jgi:hypothetical protein
MNRTIRAVAATAILTCGFGSIGCASKTGVTCEDKYRNAVDVSWPDRYDYSARESVLAPFAQQVANGHFIDQTIWNWYFEYQSDKLTRGGIDKLNALARETPSSDPKIYIQTARDLDVTPDNMDKVRSLRDDLDARRAAAVKRYMSGQPGTPVAYEVYVHDAPVPSIYGPFGAAAFNGQRAGYKGGINAGASGGGTGGGANGQATAPLVNQTTNNNGPGGAPGGAPGGPPGGGGTPPAGGY